MVKAVCPGFRPRGPRWVPTAVWGHCHGKWSKGYEGSLCLLLGEWESSWLGLMAHWALFPMSPPPPPGRASLHDKASLRLEQVRSEDQGWYECKVLMLDQQYDTFHNGSWVHLTINGA